MRFLFFLNMKITFFLLLFIQISTFAQNSKAKELLEKANKASSERKFDDALVLTLKAIEKDSNFAEAHFRAGQLFEGKLNQTKAVAAYNKAMSLKPDEITFNQAFIYTGSRALKAGDYEKALKNLSFAVKNVNESLPLYKQLRKQITNCDFALEAVKNKSIIEPKAVAGLENFAAYCYFPVLTADAQTLIFTARSESNDDNLFVSNLKNGQWQAPKSISNKINTAANEGTCSVSADGHTLVYTTCNGKDSFGSCDLYLSKKVGEDWSEPINLGLGVNSPDWESQPALSNDGRTLYFVSDRKNGFGRKDIYISFLGDDGIWTKAENLGTEVNTPYDDISPFIHANGKTLFFASDGHVGMGGLDIFFTEIITPQTSNFKTGHSWKKPENLGYPINTAADQVAMFITTDGKRAFYTFDDKKRNVIYEFNVPENLFKRFKKADFLKGIVQDAVTKKFVSANIELYDLKTNTLLQKLSSDPITGEYTAVLPNGSQFALYVNKEKYFFKSLSFDYTQDKANAGKKIDVLLEPIRTNVVERLNNIFFDSGKADLKPESTVELNKIITLLKNNTSLKIEISGHTDDVGSDQTNLVLSQKRAAAVTYFLQQNGIDINRLVAVGFGETKPIMANSSEENRQINRRIEMKIL